MGTWSHLCRFVYAGGQRPATIHIEGLDRCPYCGEVSPIMQSEVDAMAVDLLTKTHKFVNTEAHDHTNPMQ